MLPAVCLCVPAGRCRVQTCALSGVSLLCNSDNKNKQLTTTTTPSSPSTSRNPVWSQRDNQTPDRPHRVRICVMSTDQGVSQAWLHNQQAATVRNSFLWSHSSILTGLPHSKFDLSLGLTRVMQNSFFHFCHLSNFQVTGNSLLLHLRQIQGRHHT